MKITWSVVRHVGGVVLGCLIGVTIGRMVLSTRTVAAQESRSVVAQELKAVAIYGTAHTGTVYVYCDPKRPGMAFFVNVSYSGGSIVVQPAPEYCPVKE